MILTYRYLFRLKELILGILDLLLFVLQVLPQQLRLLFKLSPDLLRAGKYFLHARPPGLQSVQLVLRRARLRPNMVQSHLMEGLQPLHH